MSVDRSYISENKTQLARIQALLAGRSDAELARPMAAGWTVAGVLGHLAFWDQRALILLEHWEKKGAAPPANNEEDVDWINDAAKPMFLAVPPRRAAELWLSVAQAVDAKAAGFRDDLVARNAAAGTPVSLNRGAHRLDHLPDLERALQGR
jgi:Mycothiol maleylpyruvate isomerase N-terminal domain